MDYEKIMENQATINIGIIGHVAHGKSTLVNAISGVKTVRFKSELEKNITIKLGYANTKIYKCTMASCIRPGCYQSYKSNAKKKLTCSVKGCEGELKLVRHISFVDCPGHDVLMATMINGTAIMDAAILMIAANEPCPQPQTKEHLFALKRTNLENIIVVQNKIDLISRERSLEQYDKIVEFISTTKAAGCPIIPVSGQYKINIDAVLDYIVNKIPVTTRKIDVAPRMVIIRSFDINKPGFKVDMLSGGVIGGSLLCGKIQLNDTIEVRPGHIEKIDEKFICKPFVSKIVSLKTEETQLTEAYPGGLIGIGTEIDPSYCIADSLVGQVMGLIGEMPEVYYSLTVYYEMFEQLTSQGPADKYNINLANNEVFLLNVGSCALNASLTHHGSSQLTFTLHMPVCCDIDDKITISQKVNGNWRLVGCGQILSGTPLECVYDEDVFDLSELGNALENK